MATWLITALVLIGVLALLWTVWPTPLARWMIFVERRFGYLHGRRIECGDIDWHYLEGGHGEPLVLLHGFNGDADHFTRTSRYLSGHFRVLAPDLPGFGETRIGEEFSFRIDDIAAHVLEWIDALGVQRFYLGGNSMGGYVAAAIARHAPHRVRSLWLLAPGGLHTAPLSAVFEEIAAGRHNPLIVRDQDDFDRLIDYCFVHPPFIPGPVRRFLARRAAATEPRARIIFDAFRFDSRPLETLADGLEIPTLIMWGDSDQVLHPEGAKLLTARMPDSHQLLLRQTGHLPMLERPRLAAESWISFTQARTGR